MDRPPFVPIGRIVKTHGVKGEVSVVPAADLPFVFPSPVPVWLVPPPETVRTTFVDSVRQGPKGPLVTLRGVDDIPAARSIVGATIVARPQDLPDAWVAGVENDPVGLVVVDEERGTLGEVKDVIVTGANDVWVVRGERYGEVLLPDIPDVVLVVDRESGTARVRLLPGLIEEEA